MPTQLTISLNKAIGKTLQVSTTYSGKVYADNNLGKVIGYFTKGQVIGTIYSYTYRGTKLFWMVENNGDYIFVEHNANNLTLVNAKQIAEDIKQAQEQQIKDEKGLFQYYLDKYLPVVIFGGLAVIALPKLLKSNNG